MEVIRNTGDTISLLDSNQTRKAAQALVRHIDQHDQEKTVGKISLLADVDDDEDDENRLDVPLWVVVTAKQHLSNSHSLKPGKIPIPHPLYSSPKTQICLITADPPTGNSSAYKDVVKHEDFPKDVKSKIKKVVRFSKLRKVYKSFESRRQLFAEFDVFLADERIIHLVPAALGSTFYKSMSKRPIPVSLTGKEKAVKPKADALARIRPKRKATEHGGPEAIGAPSDVGADIEKALGTASVNLSPSPTVSVKLAYASWPVEWIVENADMAIERLISKYVPRQWNGVKSIHLKGPQTAALPIWMAEELWQSEEQVLDEGEKATGLNFEKRKRDKKPRISHAAGNVEDLESINPKENKKRKTTEHPDVEGKKPKNKKDSHEQVASDSTKQKLKRMKEQSLAEVVAAGKEEDAQAHKVKFDVEKWIWS